jgi:hypothetical protein
MYVWNELKSFIIKGELTNVPNEEIRKERRFTHIG